MNPFMHLALMPLGPFELIILAVPVILLVAVVFVVWKLLRGPSKTKTPPKDGPGE